MKAEATMLGYNAESFWGANTQPERLDAVLKHSPSGSRILDLGSGRGAYSEVLTRDGFLPVGIDIHYYPEWIHTRQRMFATATGTNLPFAEKSFDVTIAFEVLEHISDPNSALDEIARCTSDKFIFSVPNCDLNNSLRRYDLAMAHWTDPTHCNFFTKKSIETLLNNKGYQVNEILDCYKINPNNYFWDSVRLPRSITRVLKKLFNNLRLTEIYWSSILVVAEVPRSLKR